MKTIHATKQKVIFTFLWAISVTASFAQLSISIPLGSKLPSKNIEVLSVDFMTEEISKWGSLDESGDITFFFKL